MAKKTSMKKMVSLFDDAWKRTISGEVSFVEEWERILKENKWTDEEFDQKLETYSEHNE